MKLKCKDCALINEAVTDYYAGKLSADTTILVIANIVNPTEATDKDVRSAQDRLRELGVMEKL